MKYLGLDINSREHNHISLSDGLFFNQENNNLNLDLEYHKPRLNKFNSYIPYSLFRASWDQLVEFEKNKFLFTAIKIIESKKKKIR